MMAEVVPVSALTLTTGSLAVGSAMVFTPPTNTIARAYIIQRRRDIFVEHATGIIIIGRSGNWEDNVDGLIF